jgi:hypothetical protein
MTWQPIATAPEGIPILVTDGEVIVVVSRGECAGAPWPDSVGFGGPEWDFYFDWEDLTHWMPLPALPQLGLT